MSRSSSSVEATDPCGPQDKRRAYLEQLRRVLPPSEPWEAWLAETGELPPDFDALPRCPELPNPLLREVAGRMQPVETPADWRERRQELLALFQHWMLGRVPPPPEFGRGRYAFPERLIHPVSWEAWRAESGEAVAVSDLAEPEAPPAADSVAAWEAQRENVRARVQWMLGEPPAGATSPDGIYGEEVGHIASLLGRDTAGEGLEKQQAVFGEYISGDVYLPAGLAQSGRRAPAILWLHPFSTANGYVAWYRRGEQGFHTLARAGYAVFCYDQIGCGRRIEEAEGFYQRYPHWSLLGKMVRDAQAALDLLVGLPYVDPEQVWALGYGLGSLVGLHLGALDGRLVGLVSVCGPQPFRRDTPDRGFGGIGRWSHRHLVLPRLGFFVGREAWAPYDVDDLLACLAPRPALVVSPQLDREAALADVTQAVEAARRVYALYGAGEALEQRSPEDYNRWSPEMQGLVLDWLKERGRWS